MGATRASFLVQATVLLTPLLSLAAGYRPGRRVWGACALALAGCLAIAGDGADAVEGGGEAAAGLLHFGELPCLVGVRAGRMAGGVAGRDSREHWTRLSQQGEGRAWRVGSSLKGSSRAWAAVQGRLSSHFPPSPPILHRWRRRHPCRRFVLLAGGCAHDWLRPQPARCQGAGNVGLLLLLG